MSDTVKNIGLALSGGGFRAAVYHLGVLARLAESNLLEEVTAISTVSGGSLGTGLILTLNNNQWPTSQEYKASVVRKARECITTQDLQSNLIWRFLYACVTLQWGSLLTRATDLANLLRDRWGVTAALSDLPDRPRWYINATCYESGKDWRFAKKSAGDYRFGYTHQTDKIRLCEAMAASAGFPGLVGALPLDTTKFTWDEPRVGTPQPAGGLLSARDDTLNRSDYPTVHLWDGGVYDNNGLEVFHDFNSPRWQQGVEFLFVSDASGQTRAEAYQIGVRALFRMMTGVMMAQIRALRSRAVVALMSKPSTQAEGVYLRIGNTAQKVLTAGQASPDLIAQYTQECLSPEVVDQTEHLQTEIRRLTPEEFSNLFRHGFEVADYTLFAYHPNKFQYIGYSRSAWPSIISA